MEFIKDFFDSMDGSVIEYCILGAIVVLVGILIASIISCIKSLKKKDNKNIPFSKLSIEEQDIDLDIDPIEQLKNEVIDEKKEDILILEDEDELKEKENVVIASKIEIPQIQEEIVEEIETKPEEKVIPKLDIKSITREMELKMEEEPSVIEAYEDEQEKTAIISYKELLEAAARIEANADNEEDYLDDVVFEFSSKKITDEKENVVSEVKKNTKFVPTLDISPIFGKRDLSKTNQTEDIFEIEEVEDEKTIENEQFLENLKNFRSNLD